MFILCWQGDLNWGFVVLFSLHIYLLHFQNNVYYALPRISVWQDSDPKSKLFLCSSPTLSFFFFFKQKKSVKYFLAGWAYTSLVWKRLERTRLTESGEQTWPCCCMAKGLFWFSGQREMSWGLCSTVTWLMVWACKALPSNTLWIHRPFSLFFKCSSRLSVIPFLFATKGKPCAMNKGERDATY